MNPADDDETPMQTSIHTDVLGNGENNEAGVLELQEANYISSEAYKEFMRTTLKEFTSIAASPALGSDEAILQVFRSLPSTGIRDELSIYSADVPVASDVLVSMMLDVNRWALSLSHIVYCASSNIPTSILQQLSSSDVAIKKILMIDSELQLQLPSVQRQNFYFLRLLKEINADTWVIFDVSNDYFLHKSDFSSEQKCWRRRSGLIVRRVKNYSRVIWVENVEAPECQLKDNICSGMINSEIGLSAKRWVTTLTWWLKRNDSIFTNDRMQVNGKVHTLLLNLTESMKMVFLDIVNATPDDRKWVILHNQKPRVLRSMTGHVNVLGWNMYVGVTTFRLEVTPCEVFDILVKKNVELQWPISQQSFRKREEMIKSVTKDGSNCVTLLKREIYESMFATKPKDSEYLLQEASKDGFCSFIISAPMSERDVYSSLYFGTGGDVLLLPAGFAIVPDGLKPGASLVTFVTKQRLNTSDIERAVENMKFLLECMILEIEQEVHLELLETMEYSSHRV